MNIVVGEDEWSLVAAMIEAAMRRDRRKWRKLARELVPAKDPLRLFVYLTTLLTWLEQEALLGAGSFDEIDQLIADRAGDWRSVTPAPLSVFRDALVVACAGIPAVERYAPSPSTGDLILAIATLLRRSERTVSALRTYVVETFGEVDFEV